MFFVYVLQSRKNGRLYAGFTVNLERRLAEHNLGRTKSIRFVRPLVLLYFEKFLTRLEAARRERYLKSGIGREELSNILACAENELGGGVAQLGERLLCKQEVTGSNPVTSKI